MRSVLESRFPWVLLLVAALLWIGGALPGRAVPAGPATLDPLQSSDVVGNLRHCTAEVQSRNFQKIFACGNVFFDTDFNAADGVGANVGDGSRFTRVPRSDLSGPGQWAMHKPPRSTGPSSTGCINCHSRPVEDGAGDVVTNNVLDPKRLGNPKTFTHRQPPHIFGMGAVQLLAEELNTELMQRIADANQLAMSGQDSMIPLVAKDVNFGTATVMGGMVQVAVQGVDADLVVKPFEWKGVVRNVREFVRDAANSELGMNPVETAGNGVDGDGDGVVNEVLISDITALTLYQAGQPRPTTRTELASLRADLVRRFGREGARKAAELGLPTLSAAERQAVARGAQLFAAIGCADCHRPELRLSGRVFSEPSQNPNYREDVFPAGQPRGLTPQTALHFDITRDQPDNQIQIGSQVIHFGSFPTNPDGTVSIHLLGDLKRHDMGPGLAEPVDASGTGASVFLTENLWGVGSTPPYLHDGRATTLPEAILAHGGEAQVSKMNFAGLAAARRRDVLAFLGDQVLVLFGGEDDSDSSGGASND